MLFLWLAPFLLAVFSPLLLMFRLFSLLVLALSSLCLPTAVAVSAQTTGAVTTAERSTSAFSQLICQRLDSLVQLPLMERSQLGLCVYDLTTDSMLYVHGHQQRMRPASSMKVVTAVTALDKLGGDYQFSTQLYSTVPPTDSVLQGSLVARGGFDPLFGRDDLRAFVEALRQRGIRRITGDLVLDVSLKDTTSLGWGWCWDDKNKPLTPLLYRGNDSWADHFYEQLERAGITLEGNIHRGILPRGVQLLVERKHSIDQVLRPMLKDSNNLCAEAMFYQLAALSKCAYATHKDAAAQVQRVIAQCGLQPSDYLVADGSGLSLYNYVSPELLVAMLRYAARSEETFTHLTTALPIMGRDGTLKSRCRRTPAQDNVRAKTGTVEGVSSLTGYAMAANGHRLCFAIINQGVRTTAEGRNFQDAVCRALTQGFDTPHIRPDVQPDIVPSGEEEQNTPSLLEENP